MEEERDRGEQPVMNTGSTSIGDKPPGKRRKKVVILYSLLGVLILLVTVSGYYLLTRKPLTQLPVVQALGKNVKPRFVFSIYDVTRPVGVAVSPDGQRVYVSESDGQRLVKVFDRNGRLYGELTPPVGVAAGGRQPVYIAVDRSGKIYVSDRMLHDVLIYSPEGKYLGNLPSPAKDYVWSPVGLSIEKDNNLYVTDFSEGQHSVFVFDLLGNVLMTFGKQGEGKGEFSFPNGVAVDNKGRMFVSNSNNGRIDMFDSTGRYSTSFGMGTSAGSVGIPRGVAIDEMDRLYVADPMSHQFVVYDVGGQGVPALLFEIGGKGIDDGQFMFPNDVAVDPTGRVYMTDRENHRVQVWTY